MSPIIFSYNNNVVPEPPPPITYYSVTLSAKRNAFTPSNTTVDIIYNVNGGSYITYSTALTTSYQTVFSIGTFQYGDILTFAAQQSSVDISYGMGFGGSYSTYCFTTALYTAPAITANTQFYMNVDTTNPVGYIEC